jgi:molybdopterin synthase sulfur carrier subunit
MAIQVRVPTILRRHTGGQAVVEGKGETLRDLLTDLEGRYPGISRNVMTEEGQLRRFVNVYLNDEDVRYLGSLETDVKEGDTVSILPAVAGGTT